MWLVRVALSRVELYCQCNKQTTAFLGKRNQKIRLSAAAAGGVARFTTHTRLNDDDDVDDGDEGGGRRGGGDDEPRRRRLLFSSAKKFRGRTRHLGFSKCTRSKIEGKQVVLFMIE